LPIQPERDAAGIVRGIAAARTKIAQQRLKRRLPLWRLVGLRGAQRRQQDHQHGEHGVAHRGILRSWCEQMPAARRDARGIGA
jgi:hypothetical protein